MDFITIIFIVLGCHTKSVSSTNYNKITSSALFHTPTPSSNCLLVAYLKNIKNINGTVGSPCLNPLIGFISWVGLPYTKIDTKADSRHACIHLIHFLQNPNLLIM